MAERVKSLRQEKVKEMIRKATAVLADDDGHSSRRRQELMSTSVKKDQAIRQYKVVGFEDEEETIKGYLMEPKDELDVISIIGMPGLGKTTLAWKIYNSGTIQNEFRIRIWVNVSQNFKIRDLFLNILRSFSSQDMSSVSDTELEREVQVCLKEERFLIVLDDLRSVDDWDAIKKVLTMRNTMGRVLITSCHTQVGERAGVAQMLRFLNKEESWHLLQLEVFGDADVCPVELIDIGKQLAHNCGGLPLTIVVVGGILVAHYTRQQSLDVIKDDWIEVSQNVTDFIQRDKSDHILKVIALSYNILPDELRDCFLYVGVFPRDCEIPAWTLTRLWIAEGFIQKKPGQTLEETAVSYLNDLINRNLLAVGKTNPLGRVKTCRVYDVIRVFCISKAAELDLFHEIKNLEQGLSETRNSRRLSIHSDLSKFLSTIPEGQRARSLLCFYKETLNLDSRQTIAIPRAFRLLRVLDSNSVIRFHQFPPTLSDLIHLKYITLYVNDLKVVPESIAGLWNLQSLVVDTSSYTLTMKANIWRMIQLRHLKTKASIVLDQQNWEGQSGEKLQTLSTLSPESFNETVSNRASYLKKLGIRGKLDALPDPKLLGKLGRLESLKLVNRRSAEDELFHLPQPDYFPPNLKTLTLTKTSLDWIHMSGKH